MSKEYYGEPLIITYSGGKDSDVLLYLAENCLNVGDFEVLNSHTTVDAPECIYDEPLEPYICEADWNCKDCPNWRGEKAKATIEADKEE